MSAGLTVRSGVQTKGPVRPGTRQHRLPLEEGLGSPDAQLVLRALDGDGHLGLRDAPGELLDGLREHTRGFPRALEAVKAILDGDGTLTPRDLLDRARRLSEDQVVQVLVARQPVLLVRRAAPCDRWVTGGYRYRWRGPGDGVRG